MRKIEAFEASDGTKFFTEAECKQHEANKLFSAWYYLGHQIDSEDSDEVFYWLKGNAEAIRGFLPPVAAKPELDITILEAAAFNHGRESDVRLKDVKRWLAGELK